MIGHLIPDRICTAPQRHKLVPSDDCVGVPTCFSAGTDVGCGRPVIRRREVAGGVSTKKLSEKGAWVRMEGLRYHLTPLGVRQRDLGNFGLRRLRSIPSPAASPRTRLSPTNPTTVS